MKKYFSPLPVNPDLGSYKQMILLWLLLLYFPAGVFAQVTSPDMPSPERLSVSSKNQHLMATSTGKPVFLNSYTVWQLLRNGSRDDVKELIGILSERKINTISTMILDFEPNPPGRNYYGDSAFEPGKNGMPDPSKPITTAGNNPLSADEYDFWDHLDFVLEAAGEMGIFLIKIVVRQQESNSSGFCSHMKPLRYLNLETYEV